MKNAAIFGSGTAGRRACLHLRSKYRIASFLDNNRGAHGSRVFGIPVHDPEDYDYSRVDHVFIGSMYFDEILVQLLALGVPSSKIEYLSNEILMRDQPNSPGVGFCLFGSFDILRRAFYLPFRLLR